MGLILLDFSKFVDPDFQNVLRISVSTGAKRSALIMYDGSVYMIQFTY